MSGHGSNQGSLEGATQMGTGNLSTPPNLRL
jgi:hypothetical protein